MTAVVVSEVAHDPDAGVVHLDDGGDALCRAQPQAGHTHGCGKWIAVQGDDGEGVAGQREAANLARASVEHVEEHALSLFYADRLAMAEHPAVDGEGVVADFVTVLVAFGERGAHRALTLIFERWDGSGGREKVHRHVAATAECGLKLLEREKDFAVVRARIVLRLDVDRADESAVLAGAEVCAGSDVRVIEAQAGWSGYEGDAAAPVWRHEGRALFRGAIDIGRDGLAVPMDLLRPVGVIVDVDGDALAFFEAQQRAGELTVVVGDGDDAIGRELDGRGGDGEAVVGGRLAGRGGGLCAQ